MSVVIIFPNGMDWFKANWVFRRLAGDICVRYRKDDGICKVLAQALGSLNIKNMTDELRPRVMQAIKIVAEEGGHNIRNRSPRRCARDALLSYRACRNLASRHTAARRGD